MSDPAPLLFGLTKTDLSELSAPLVAVVIAIMVIMLVIRPLVTKALETAREVAIRAHTHGMLIPKHNLSDVGTHHFAGKPNSAGDYPVIAPAGNTGGFVLNTCTLAPGIGTVTVAIGTNHDNARVIFAAMGSAASLPYPLWIERGTGLWIGGDESGKAWATWTPYI